MITYLDLYFQETTAITIDCYSKLELNLELMNYYL